MVVQGKRKIDTKKYIWFCIALSIMLCFLHIRGRTIITLIALAGYLVCVALACNQGMTLPVLLYFLPWSPLMRTSPNSFSFYTFGLVLACAISVFKSGFHVKPYPVMAGILLLLTTLLSKLIHGYSLSFDYIAFIMMIVLFPTIKEEEQDAHYTFWDLVVFFSLGIIIAALCAQKFAVYGGIARFIRVDSYTTITRRCGFYGDPNFYVAQITAALAGCLLLVLKTTVKRNTLFLCGLIFLLIYCGFLSGSKSFALITGALVFIWLIQLLLLKGRIPLKIMLILILVIMGGYIMTSAIFEELIDVIVTRFSNATNLSNFTTHRTDLWKNYLDTILADWKTILLGNGFSNIKVGGRGSHNSIIQMLWQFGAIGTPIVVCWMIFFVKDGLKSRHEKHEHILSALTLLLGVYLPWLAIDILYFDDFFLLQAYIIYGLNEGSNMNEDKVTVGERTSIDLVRLLRSVWSKAWIVAIVSILSMVLVFLVTFFFVTPEYEAHAMFYVNNSSIGLGDASISLSSSDITASKSLVDTYIVILDTWETQRDVIDYAGLDLTTSDFEDMVSSASVNETEVFRVTITSEDPVEAEKLANAVAYILPKRIGTIVEGTSAQIVSSARTPSKPSSPNYIMNSLVGFILGFVMSVGIIALREWLDITVSEEEDIIQSCPHPILVSVPDMTASGKGASPYYGYGSSRSNTKKAKYAAKKQPAKQALMGPDISFAASEAYKLLRTKLQFSFADENNSHVIGLSSALSGEGKSLTSVNLAFTLSQLGKKVLLVDCDMRRPTLAEKLGIQKQPGLSNYLIRQSSLNDLLQPCGIKGDEYAFHVISAGQNPPNPIELLSSERMKKALAAMRDAYDFVILDLPPVGEVSDAMAVAKETDGMLLVVRQNFCNRIVLSDAVQQFEFINAKILGVVFNGTSERSSNYGKGHYKSYYKHYGKNYAENDRSVSASTNGRRKA